MHKFLWIAALLLVFTQQAAAKMYKWVDENGVTHFGDTIPPQYKGPSEEINKPRSEKGERAPGVVREKAEESAEQIEAKKRAEQKRQDKALLNTYSNEQEIDLKRDRDLQQVEAAIVGIQIRLKAVETSLADLRKQADSYAQKKKPVPASLQEEIAKTEAEKQAQEDKLAARKQEEEGIRAKFEAFKKRYIELRGSSEPKTGK